MAEKRPPGAQVNHGSDNNLVDIVKVTQLVPLSQEVIRRKLEENNVPVFKFGRKRLVKESEVLALLRS